MIDLIKNTAGLRNDPIKAWNVAFYVPQLGLYPTAQLAVDGIKAIMPDADPRLLIIPVPIAVMENGSYEVVIR